MTCLESAGDPRTVAGLVLNTPEGQISTGPRPLAENLDDLPRPVRSLTKRHRSLYFLGLDRPLAVVESARGCPYRCTFCSVWRFYRGRFRAKSAGRVIDEIASVEERHVFISDDNFLADPERAMAIAQGLAARGVRHTYSFQARSDAIASRPDLIRTWRQLGLIAVLVGVEGIKDDGLKAVRKHNSAANNDQALDVLRREGVSVVASFIIDPSWERSDFESLGRYVISHQIRTPVFTVLTPLPGTVLHRQLRDQLQTDAYELFDLAHAVVPTKLPLDQFYGEMERLYRLVYTWQRVLPEVLRLLWRGVTTRSLSAAHAWRLSGALRSAPTASRLLAAHECARMRVPSTHPSPRAPSPRANGAAERLRPRTDGVPDPRTAAADPRA